VSDVRAAQATYRSVLRDREFRAVFVSDGLSVVGDQVARIAVALLVFDRTGSVLAASATYACSYLAWLLGGPVLSTLADRLPRRRVIVACDIARAVLVLSLVVPGLPLWVIFGVLLLVGLLAPPFDAARSALMADVLEGDRYVVGNALIGTVGQAGQVGGFVAGGALVALLGVQGALIVDAATFVVSALLFVLMVRDRPVLAPPDTSASFGSELAAGVRVVRASPDLRRLLGWGVLVAAMTIAPEGMAVAVAHDLGGGSVAAGMLTATVPAGFVLGCWLVLRLPIHRRQQSFPWLVLLSAAALAVSPWLDSIWQLVLLWTVAGVGTSLQLVANAAFVQAVPQHLRGRAFGVAGTVLMAVQGVVLLAAGALAEATGARAAVAVFAVSGLAVMAAALAVGRKRVLAQGADGSLR
jgi:MFS family permease